MSSYAYLYLEANVNGNWRCISPMFPSVMKEPKYPEEDYSTPGTPKFAAIYWGSTSFARGFVSEDLDYYNISYKDISKELYENLFSKKYRDEIEATDRGEKTGFDGFYLDLRAVDSNALLRMAEDARKEYDMSGYVTNKEAELIKAGENSEDIYPVTFADIVDELSEYEDKAKNISISDTLFDKFYTKVQYVQTFGKLYYEKLIIERINAIIDMANDATSRYGDDEITLSNCRLIINYC